MMHHRLRKNHLYLKHAPTLAVLLAATVAQATPAAVAEQVAKMLRAVAVVHVLIIAQKPYVNT